MFGNSKFVSVEFILFSIGFNFFFLAPIVLHINNDVYLTLFLILMGLVSLFTLRVSNHLKLTDDARFTLFYVNISNLLFIIILLFFKSTFSKMYIYDGMINYNINMTETYFRFFIKTCITGLFLSKITSIVVALILILATIFAYINPFEAYIHAITLHYVLFTAVLTYVSIELYKRRDFLINSLDFTISNSIV